jgi:uncharacterized caspase-like protein
MVILVVLGAFGVLGAQPASSGASWGVVIGAGHPSRKFATADAEVMYQTLIGPMGVEKANVVLLTDRTERRPTIRNILWALGTFLGRSARADDTVFVFIAGHGAIEGRPYLVAADSDPRDLYSTALPVDQLGEVLGRLESARVIVFLDMSYSGAVGGPVFTTQKPGRGGEGARLEALARASRVVFVASSRPNEISLEAPDLGHGIFTYWLVEGLRGAADRDGDGFVGLQELFEYAEPQTAQRSRAVGGNQHPVMRGSPDALPLTRVRRP